MLPLSAFGKNDIRGIYGEDITEELFYYTGQNRGFQVQIGPLQKNSSKMLKECGGNDTMGIKLTETGDEQ